MQSYTGGEVTLLLLMPRTLRNLQLLLYANCDGSALQQNIDATQLLEPPTRPSGLVDSYKVGRSNGGRQAHVIDNRTRDMLHARTCRPCVARHWIARWHSVIMTDIKFAGQGHVGGSGAVRCSRNAKSRQAKVGCEDDAVAQRRYWLEAHGIACSMIITGSEIHRQEDLVRSSGAFVTSFSACNPSILPVLFLFSSRPCRIVHHHYQQNKTF